MPEGKPVRALHWDGTVTAGNVLTAAAMLVAMLAWGFRLESTTAQTAERLAIFERIVAERRAEDRGNVADALRKVEGALGRIEGILMNPQRER